MAEKTSRGAVVARAKAPPGAAARKPARRSQEERSADTRRRLIQAAIQVLRDQGYANLTITKVSQRAGVTNGAMQHHFRSREDLMLALMEQVYPVLQIPFEDIAAEDLAPPARVGRLVDLLWAIYSRPEYLVVWDIALGARGERKLWARVRAYQKEVSGRMRSEFVRLFPEFDLSEDDADGILLVAVGAIRGIAFQSMFGADQLKHVDFRVIKDTAYRQLAAHPQVGS